MAQCELAGSEWKMPIQSQSGYPMGIRVILEGTTAEFTVLVLNGGTTSYYIWVDTTGDLRIGTTEPTTAATRDSAGAVVGDQAA